MMPIPASPAATLVLMRPTIDGAPEILLVERAARMAFAAGAMVFPGGRVDPGDHAIAAGASAFALDPADSAGRIAAIRETIEEVGIAVGIAPAPSAETIAKVRAALADGHSFADLIAENRWVLDLDALTPFARWCPSLREKRVFDTRFYAAAIPAGTIAHADGGECVQARWVRAADAIALDAAGEIRLIFPTRCNLARIAAHPDFAAFAVDAAGYEICTIAPWIEQRDGAEWLCIPDDLGYPITTQLVSHAKRG